MFLNTGHGWATSTAYTFSGNIATCGSSGTTYNEYANWTGNGQMVQDVMTYVITPQGATESILYTPSAQTGTNPNLPLSLLAVSAVGVNDGFGTISTTTFAYAGGTLYFTAKQDRRFAGFAVATTTAPDAVTATYYSQGNTAATGMGEQSDGFALINRPFRRDVFDLSGTLLERTLYRYDTHVVGSSTFVGIGAELVSSFGAGEQKDRATEYQYATTTQTYDVTRVTEHGEVTGAAAGTFSDLGTDTRTTDITYASATTTATTTEFYGGGGMALLKKAIESFFAMVGNLFDDSEIPTEEKPKQLHELIADKPQQEKATLKGAAIKDALNARVRERIYGRVYDVEIASVEAIEGGVQVLARAWDKDGVQLGFGRDGSVEVERFRFFNPPILVHDPNGDIERTYTTDSGEVLTWRLREDPAAALLESLEHVIAVKKEKFGPEKLVRGKTGNTTSTFYPASGGSTSVDGMVRYDPGPSGGTWSTARNDAGTSANYTDTQMSVRLRGASTANQWRTMDRAITGFDTSPIPDSDDVAAATVSLYGTFKNNTTSYGGLKIVVDHTIPASTNSLVAGDYAISDWDSVLQSNTEISFASWSTTGYNDFELNGTGVEKVSKTGVTWLGWRTDKDLSNTEPTYENSVESDAGFYAADDSGTSRGPKLVVEHSAFESTGSDVWVPLSYPAKETVSNHSGTRVKESKYYYDNLAHGSVSTGNLTKRETWVTGSTYVSEQIAYNAYGLVASTTDPRGKITTNTFDHSNLYVATSTNPLSQQTQFYYDYTLGKPKATIDANSLRFETVYDGLDRPTVERQPDLADPSSLVTKKSYAYTDTVGARKVVETQSLDGSVDTVVYKYYDGFDRPIQVRKEAEGSGQYTVRDFAYNAAGLLARESLPYFSSGTSRTSVSGTAALFTNYTYDSLRRLLTGATAVGTTTTTYGAWSATTTDANGNAKGVTYDAYARLVGVTESLSSALYTTRYEYDVLGNLTKITDASGNIRSFTYDGRGKRLTAEDLHAVGDATYGTWSYTYDDGGNLSSAVDPKGQQTDYTYDDLSRALTENYTGASGTEVTYVYDTCTYGVGRLCIATSTGAATVQSYNALGAVATSTRTILDTPYVTTFLYDRQGNQTHIKYPDSSWVRYAYNCAGLLETIAQRETSDVFRHLVSDLDYAPTERPTYKALGNGVQSTYTYDANALYRLTNILTIASSTWSGGGPLAFGGSQGFMQYLARAVAELPWALEGDIALDVASTSDPTTTEPVVEESLPQVSLTPISDQIAEKSAEEKATIKGEEIATLGKIEREKRGAYEIEVLSMEAIPGGVQLFARAWDEKGEQIGFGADGSVDVERFRFFNPPILVFDPEGPIEREYVKDEETKYTWRLREDPREALLQSLEHVLSVKQEKFTSEKIVREKVGNTTSTFYPASGGSSPMDAQIAYDAGSGGATWATIHDAAVGNDNVSATDTQNGLTIRSASSGWRKLRRVILGFDTSAIANDDTVSAATLSIYGAGSENPSTFGADVIIDRTVPDSTSNITTSDYNEADWANAKQSDTETAWTSISTSAYNDFTLNATGRGNVSKTGLSWFGVRSDYDLEDTAPSHPGAAESGINFYAADQSGTASDPKLVVEHSSSNYSPLPPAAPLVEGLPYASHITDPTPEFSAIYSDPDAADTATHYRLQVSSSTSFSTLDWDTNQTALASTTANGFRVSDIPYTGSALASSTLYYWRIKFWDEEGLDSAYSTSSAFTLAPALGAPTYVEVVQNTTFTYDAVGNITQLTDYADTGVGKTVTYTYDSLYRLTSASTTAASSTPYSLSYTYDILGNINSFENTAYTYNTPGYANPHAATVIAGIPQYYDQNGNLASTTRTTLSWDYRNRLLSYGTGISTTTFGYDHGPDRVFKATGTATTTYVSKLYNTDNSHTKHVFTPQGDLIATIIGTTASTSATTTYAHTDHLGGTAVTTNTDGDVTGLSDFYPYGAPRVSLSYTGTPEQRKFASTERDIETSMDYMQHRFYLASEGRFISQDPNFWHELNLSDPQGQNSYSYANGNPINKKDPDGLAARGPNSAEVQAIIQSEIRRSQQQFADRVNSLTDAARTSYLQALGAGGNAFWDPVEGIRTLLAQNSTYAQKFGAGVGVIGGAYGPGKFGAAKTGLAGAKVVGNALKQDILHKAPTFMREVADEFGVKTIEKGGDGVVYFWTRIEGGLDYGKGMIKGTYEYIQNSVGEITHQLFRPGGSIK